MTTLVSLLGYLLMVAGILGLIVHRDLLSPAPAVILLQAGAVCLMLWARWTFGRRSFHATATPTQGGLVTTGPYRWIRHPIYAAVCLFATACVLGHPSLFSLGVAGIAAIGSAMRILAEEALLRKRYPEYEEYAHKTRRVLPYLF